MFCVALTWSGCFNVDRLEAPIQCWGVDDVRVKVTVGLAVDKESHDDGDDQAHNYSDYNAHVQRHIICTRSGWRGHKKEERKTQMLLDAKHLLKTICISERKFSWNIRAVAESNVVFFKVGQDEMFIRLQIINFKLLCHPEFVSDDFTFTSDHPSDSKDNIYRFYFKWNFQIALQLL